MRTSKSISGKGLLRFAKIGAALCCVLAIVSVAVAVETSIPIHLEEVGGIARVATPVTAGIPFPKGVLTDERRVQLKDPAGKAVPMKTQVLARWKDKSVKWLLLDFAADVPANSRPAYRLDWSKKASPPAAKKIVTVTKVDNGVDVDTGVLKFTVRKDKFRLFENATVNGRRITSDKEAEKCFIELEHTGPGKTDEENWLRDSGGGDGDMFLASSAGDLKVEIESANPMRAVIKISGVHVNSAGRKFAPYAIRITAYAGQAQVKLLHTFVYDGNPKKDYIRSMGITIPTALTGSKSCQIGGEHTMLHKLPTGEGVSLLSIGPKKYYHGVTRESIKPVSYTINRLTSDGKSETIASGKEALGSVAIGGTKGGLGIVIRDFWKHHPKEMLVNETDASITVGLWPMHGKKVLDLRRYADDAQQWIRHPGEGWRKEFKPIGSAVGLAKTHEMTVVFSDSPQLDMVPIATAQNEPLLPFVTPEWYAKTFVFGPIHPYDPKRFPRLEGAAVVLLDWMLRNQREFQWIGFLDYGDFQWDFYGKWAPIRKWKWKMPDFTWLARGYSGWTNNDGHIATTLLTHYFRTGSRRYYIAAEALIRHNMEVDSIHAEDPYSKNKGNKGHPRTGGGHRHDFQHFGAYVVGYGTAPHAGSYFYCLTGDGRTKDILREYGEFQLLNRNQENEEFVGAPALFYEIFGEDRYLAAARKGAEFAYGWPYGKRFRYMKNLLPGIMTYHLISEDPKAAAHMIKDANECKAKLDSRWMIYHRAMAIAYAYYLTQDKSLAPVVNGWYDLINKWNRLEHVDLRKKVPEAGVQTLPFMDHKYMVIMLQGITPERSYEIFGWLQSMPYMLNAIKDMPEILKREQEGT